MGLPGLVLLAGLAEDGGLYVPEAWPQLTPDDLRGWFESGVELANCVTDLAALPLRLGTRT